MDDNGINLIIQKGYVFRHMTQILRNENSDYNDKIHMVLNKNQISFSVSRTKPKVLHEFIFKHDKLEEYTYNVFDKEGKKLDFITLSFNTTDIANATKNIGKKDIVKIRWKQYSTKLYFSKKNPTNIGDPEITAIISCNHDPEYERPIINEKYYKKPHIKIKPKLFSNLCSQASSVKTSRLIIVYKPKVGIRFDGVNSANVLQFYKIYYFKNRKENETLEPLSQQWNFNLKDKDGRSIKIKDDSCIKFIIPSSTVKSLSKIHNIASTSSFLLFYFNKIKNLKDPSFQKFLKINSCMEGPCGDYNIYIHSEETINHSFAACAEHNIN